MPILWGLDDVMTEKQWTGYRLARATGLSASAISKLRRHTIVSRVEGNTLAKLCAALGCQPGDLLVYEPDKAQRSKPARASGKPAVRPRSSPSR